MKTSTLVIVAVLVGGAAYAWSRYGTQIRTAITPGARDTPADVPGEVDDPVREVGQDDEAGSPWGTALDAFGNAFTTAPPPRVHTFAEDALLDAPSINRY